MCWGGWVVATMELESNLKLVLRPVSAGSAVEDEINPITMFILPFIVYHAIHSSRRGVRPVHLNPIGALLSPCLDNLW